MCLPLPLARWTSRTDLSLGADHGTGCCGTCLAVFHPANGTLLPVHHDAHGNTFVLGDGQPASARPRVHNQRKGATWGLFAWLDPAAFALRPKTLHGRHLVMEAGLRSAEPSSAGPLSQDHSAAAALGRAISAACAKNLVGGSRPSSNEPNLPAPPAAMSAHQLLRSRRAPLFRLFLGRADRQTYSSAETTSAP